jgi:C-5 cytosine-specific DNA methylase
LRAVSLSAFLSCWQAARRLLDAAFEDYRLHLKKKLEKLGYVADWRLLNASEFGVPQLRPRVVIGAGIVGAFLLAESGRSQSAKRRGNTLRYDGGQGLAWCRGVARTRK